MPNKVVEDLITAVAVMANDVKWLKRLVWFGLTTNLGTLLAVLKLVFK